MDGYKKMVVIFVDLLGTKNNTKYEDKFLIHKLFHGEARSNAERNLDHVVYDRKVFSFSDCAYFFYYYKDGIEENRKNDMELIRVAMSNTSISLLRVLNAGYLVRGGIAFDNAYFDELGFFGPAVEKAYELECSYADVPMIALEPKLGEEFYKWEELNRNEEYVNLFMTSWTRLVEKDKNKYFMNMFYQVEAFCPSLHLEHDCINIEEIKTHIFKIIIRDKEKYKEKLNLSERDKTKISEHKKATIYEKLDWFQRYLETKHNRLNPDVAEGAISTIYKVY